MVSVVPITEKHKIASSRKFRAANRCELDSFAVCVLSYIKDVRDFNHLGHAETEQDEVPISISSIADFIRSSAYQYTQQNSLKISNDEPLMEMGLDSLGILELTQIIGKQFKLDLPSTVIFEYPTIDALAKIVAERLSSSSRVNLLKHSTPEHVNPFKSKYKLPSAEFHFAMKKIAVAATSCEFPFEILDTKDLMISCCLGGVDFQVTVPVCRFDTEMYGSGTRHATFVRNLAVFDGSIFRISALEALSMDPQQRKILGLCMRNYFAISSSTQCAVENAVDTSAGVFLGAMWTEYENFLNLFYGYSHGYSATGNGLSFLVGRPSFTFGLIGPNVVLDTACSSSLVAVHLATGSFDKQESVSAHAAGTQCMLMSQTFSILNSIHALSHDGRCKTLDSSADGYGRGECFATLYLQAILGNRIHRNNTMCLQLRGTGINQDGRSASFTAPYGPSQQFLIRKVNSQNHLNPNSIKFLSSHGTGTSLGDPIELAAVAKAYKGGTGVIIGASKSFMGHTEGSAGLTGFLYAAAACENRSAPSVRCCRTINPHMAVALGSIDQNKHSDENKSTGKVQFSIPRLAWSPLKSQDNNVSSISSTSSFGMSGVNSHAIIAHSGSYSDSTGAKSSHVSNMRHMWCAPALNYLCRTANVRQNKKGTVVYYHSTFENPNIAFLYHHQVCGRCILPGAASLEAVHTCSRTDLPLDFDSIAVINTAFVKPIILTRKTTLVLVRSENNGAVQMNEAAEQTSTGAKAVCQILSSMPPKYSSCLLPFPYVHSIEIKINKVVYSKVLLHGSSDGLRIHPASVDASYHELAALIAEEESLQVCSSKRKVGLKSPKVPSALQTYLVIDHEETCHAYTVAARHRLGSIDRFLRSSVDVFDAFCNQGSRAKLLALGTKQVRNMSIGKDVLVTNLMIAHHSSTDTTEQILKRDTVCSATSNASPASSAHVESMQIHLDNISNERSKNLRKRDSGNGLLYGLSWRVDMISAGSDGDAAYARAVHGLGSGYETSCSFEDSILRHVAGATMLMQASETAGVSKVTTCIRGASHCHTSPQSILLSYTARSPIYGVVGTAATEMRAVEFTTIGYSYLLGKSLPHLIDNYQVKDSHSYHSSNSISCAGMRLSSTMHPSGAWIGFGAMQLRSLQRGSLLDLSPKLWSAYDHLIKADSKLALSLTNKIPFISVRVQAVGLNFRDVLNILDMYPGIPGSPGGDFSGIVLGGANIMGASIYRPGREIFGVAPGCLGTRVSACAHAVVSKPPSLSFAEVAACPTIFCTVYLALESASLLKFPTKRALIHAGAGALDWQLVRS